MDGPLIGYQQGMTGTQILKAASIFLLAGSMTFGLAACGSDDNESTDTSTSKYSGAAEEVTPDKKAPDSAGDKVKDAPDDVISDRPGGSVQPAQP